MRKRYSTKINQSKCFQFQLLCSTSMSLTIYISVLKPQTEIIFFSVIFGIAALFTAVTVLDSAIGCLRKPICSTKWVYIATAGQCCFSICDGMLVVKISKAQIKILEMVLLPAYSLTTIVFVIEVLYILKYLLFLYIFIRNIWLF